MTHPVQDWTDFEWFVTHWPPAQVIPTLRLAATQIENLTGEYLGVRSTDKKGIIIDKIAQALRRMRQTNDLAKYQQVRARLEDVGKSYPSYRGVDTRSNAHASQPVQTPTFGGVPAASSRPGMSLARCPRLC
jgi:hypothetical protein